MTRITSTLLVAMLLATLTATTLACKGANQDANRDLDSLYSDNDTLRMYMAAIPLLKSTPAIEPEYDTDNDYIIPYPKILPNAERTKLYGANNKLKRHYWVQRLTDYYNSLRIAFLVREDMLMYMRFGDYASYPEEDSDYSWLEAIPEGIKGIHYSVISDDDVLPQVQKLLNRADSLLQNTYADLPEDYYEKTEEMVGDFYDYLSDAFMVNSWGELDDKEVEKFNPEKYVDDIADLFGKLYNDTLDIDQCIAFRKDIVKRIDNSSDMNAKCVLAGLLARFDYRYGDIDNPFRRTGLAILQEIIEEREFSYILYQTFSDWMTLKQHYYGFSNDSAIPNYYFNSIRNIAFDTMLHYVAKNDYDIAARYATVYLAGDLEVIRYASMMGNSELFRCMQSFD